MNKLSKQKRDQLILVILVTGLGISGIWFGLISFQNSHLQDLSDRTAAVRHNLDKIDQAVQHAEQLQTDLAAAGKTLLELEDDMAAARVCLAGWSRRLARSSGPTKLKCATTAPPNRPIA